MFSGLGSSFNLGGLFGGSPDAEDNQDVEHESGFERMGGAMCGVCLAPVLVLIGIILLGWNEKRAVCDAKAITQGKDNVLEVGCDSTSEGAGELVMLTCDLSKEGLSPTSLDVPSDLFDVAFPGTCLKTTSQMYQCKETKTSETKKDSIGGGKTTVHTYTYSKVWSNAHIDSGSFAKKSSDNFKTNCNQENPSWDIPLSETAYADSAKVGAWTVTSGFEAIACDTPILDEQASLSSSATGWTSESSAASFKKTINPSTITIGDATVSFTGNDWSNPKTTVLGKNSDGTLAKWTAADSWLCSGTTLYDLRQGSHSKDELFAALEAESSSLTWVLRIVGFILLWVAGCCLAGPLEVAADCIPCIGPYLGDAVQAIVSVLACFPATLICVFVVALVWVAMRPIVGVPLMLLCCLGCAVGGAIHFKAREKRKNGDGNSEGAGAPPQQFFQGQPGQSPYGAPPQQYGAPPQQYGAPPPQYGAPPPQYGAPPPQFGAGYPPPGPYPQQGYPPPGPYPQQGYPPQQAMYYPPIQVSPQQATARE